MKLSKYFLAAAAVYASAATLVMSSRASENNISIDSPLEGEEIVVPLQYEPISGVFLHQQSRDPYERDIIRSYIAEEGQMQDASAFWDLEVITQGCTAVMREANTECKGDWIRLHGASAFVANAQVVGKMVDRIPSAPWDDLRLDEMFSRTVICYPQTDNASKITTVSSHGCGVEAGWNIVIIPKEMLPRL